MQKVQEVSTRVTTFDIFSSEKLHKYEGYNQNNNVLRIIVPIITAQQITAEASKKFNFRCSF